MKGLFWKKVEAAVTKDKPTSELRFEAGSSLTYLSDLKKFVAFGSLKADAGNEPTKEVKEQPKKSPFSFKGGFSVQEKAAPALDTLQLYNASSNSWHISNCTGKYPSLRLHHYTLYEPPHFIVYSGLEKKTLLDMYVLNCNTLVWKKLFYMYSPPARLYGCFVGLKDKKYLIGGCTYPETQAQILSDIWSLSFENVNWEVTASDIPGPVWTELEYTVSNAVNQKNGFQPLKHFTALPLNDEQIYIFGGFTTGNEPTNKEFIFNATNKEMRPIESKGIKPSPRGKHKMVTIRQNLLLLYGGLTTFHSDQLKSETDIFIYHADLFTWEKPIAGGGVPHDLMYFSACHANNEIIVVGCQITGEMTQFQLISQPEEQFVAKPSKQSKELTMRTTTTISKEPQKSLQSPIEQQLQEGLRLTEKQKIQIERLQQNLSALKRQNLEMKNKIEKNRDNQRDDTEPQTLQTTEFTSKVISLLTRQQKKRKLLELKSIVLQNFIKDAQRLVVMLDGFSQQEAKAEHINMMKEFRVEMEDIWEKEKVLRKQINTKKTGLNFDLQKYFNENLSEEQAKLFAML